MSKQMTKQKEPIRVRLCSRKTYKDFYIRWETRQYWKEFSSVEALVNFLVSFRRKDNFLLFREDIPCALPICLAEDLTKDQFILFNEKFNRLVKKRTNWHNGMDDKDIFRYSDWAREWEKTHAGKK